MRSSFYIFILTLYSCSLGCNSLLCTEISKDAHWHRSECFCKIPVSNDLPNTSHKEVDYFEHLESEEIHINITNTNVGDIEVKFKLPQHSCYYKKYDITLKYHEDSTINNCSSLTDADGDYSDFNTKNSIHIHSSREYGTTNISSITGKMICSEYAVVRFNYVFTGCYSVHITPYIDDISSRRSAEKHQFITTSFKKSDVKNLSESVSVANQYYENENKLISRFSMDHNMAPTGPMLVALQLRRSHCSLSGHEHDCCVIGTNSRETVCRKDPEHSQLRCKLSNNTIECTFSDVKPGNYCTLLAIQDDRCNGHSIWAEPGNQPSLVCLWNNDFEVIKNNNPTLPVEPIPNIVSRWPVWVVLGLVVTGIFIALLYGLYVLMTLAKRRPETLQDLNEINCENEADYPLINGKSQKILLLYARDCEPFMYMMQSLRELLQKYCKCEVLDCYDEDNQQEIFAREHDWLLGHMNHVPMTDLKVVLVVTECSAAHQLSQLGCRQPVIYSNPDPCDKIFPLALKLLKEDVNPGLYARVKLVEFRGFKLEHENIHLFPTPFTRFTLPSDFKELIRSLKLLRNADELNMCDDDLKNLHSNLDDLLEFKKQNPDYLKHVINF